MSELRQNLATREWVIIASERSKRPNAFVESAHRTLTEEHSAYDPDCPFCPGNEELDLEVERFPAEGPWHTRVVRNKFPALAEAGMLTRVFDGVQRRIAGVGHHEIVVEHPRHNTTLALMLPHEIQSVLETFQQRGQEISTDHRVEQIIYFKNHGQSAGASLIHPHSQIIGLPVVPNTIRRRIDEARRYFDDNGQCVFCYMLEDELTRGERVITVNEHFVAFVLYAALSPFHIWIVPRRHSANFLDIQPEEISSLAQVVQEVVRKLYVGLRDPDYNLIIRSGPVKEPGSVYFHWYVSLVPRVNRAAGFEMGSGMYINPSLPEASAVFLRDVQI
jgi:UDPglucose--hexose-1-phosphate uridylyltransferase